MLRVLRALAVFVLLCVGVVQLRASESQKERGRAYDSIRSLPLAELTVDRLHRIAPEARLLNQEEVSLFLSTTNVPSAAEDWPLGILYLRMKALGNGSVQRALGQLPSEFRPERQDGVILDLRGSDGWDIKAVEEIAGLFLPERTPICRIVAERDEGMDFLRAESSSLFFGDAFVTILVDESTRGLPEMFAGTMSGRRNVLVMGQKTAGKAYLSDLLLLADGRGLLVVSGWSDWGVGTKKAVLPDVSIERTTEDNVPVPSRRGRESEEQMQIFRRTSSDNLLRRSTDILLSRKRLNKGVKDDGEDS